MCLTFQMMTLEKYFTKNFEFFLGGTPILAPQSAASPKMTISPLPMTQFFIYIRVFSLKKTFSNLFIFFAVNQRFFKILSKKKSYMVNNTG